VTRKDGLRLLELAREVLILRGSCGAWVPGREAVCALPRGHYPATPCGGAQ
jgi:hypothetical protein